MTDLHAQPAEPAEPGVCIRCGEAEVDLAESPVCRDCKLSRSRPIVWTAPEGSDLPPAHDCVVGDVALVGEARWQWNGAVWAKRPEVSYAEWARATVNELAVAKVNGRSLEVMVDAAWSVRPWSLTMTYSTPEPGGWPDGWPERDVDARHRDHARQLWIAALSSRVIPMGLPTYERVDHHPGIDGHQAPVPGVEYWRVTVTGRPASVNGE